MTTQAQSGWHRWAADEQPMHVEQARAWKCLIGQSGSGAIIEVHAESKERAEVISDMIVVAVNSNHKDIFGEVVVSDDVVALRREVKTEISKRTAIEARIISVAVAICCKRDGLFPDEVAGMTIEESMEIIERATEPIAHSE